MRRRPWTFAVVLLVMVTVAGCRSPGATRATGTSVDELARQLSGSSDDAALWEERLRAANGGRDTVDDEIAGQLRSRTGSVDAIWTTTKNASGLACDAWTNGGDQILTDDLVSLATRVQAQHLLNRINSDVDAGVVAADTITIACELAGLEF